MDVRVTEFDPIAETPDPFTKRPPWSQEKTYIPDNEHGQPTPIGSLTPIERFAHSMGRFAAKAKAQVLSFVPSNWRPSDSDQTHCDTPSILEKGLVKTHEHQVGWVRLTVLLIVEAIALGALSLPKAYATLGMVPGTLITVFLGLLAVYASYVLGQMKMRHEWIATYSDAVHQAFGKKARHACDVAMILQLTLLVGSHALTGSIAFTKITKSNLCAIAWNAISTGILFALAVPPRFSEVAILGYVDFGSILSAIMVTMVATGVRGSSRPGGLGAVKWSCWPPKSTSLAAGMNAVSNITFAYSFAMAQFSFMSEMHTPSDYVKAIIALGIVELLIYVLTGALIYRFVGEDVESPALLSAGDLVSRIVFGLALPVIFISGSINTTVLGRLIHGRVFYNTPTGRIKDFKGWFTWLLTAGLISFFAWLVAEVIPFFSDLLSLCSSLFISGFSYYVPGLMFFVHLWDKKMRKPMDLLHISLNLLCIIVGAISCGLGTYAAVSSIVMEYQQGAVSRPFACELPG